MNLLNQQRAEQFLYPPTAPFDQFMLRVDNGHEIFVEQSGAKDGYPILILHGGPGGGISPALRRFANPKVFRIICFDQRGCGKSRPFASVENNTTWDLISDIERIRNLFNISKWAVFGGSWGATLALTYAQTHPEHVSHLVLRSVFLGTQKELDWFYGKGAAGFWPDTWANFIDGINEEEQGDIITAFNKRLFCGDRLVEQKYARQWASWENALAYIGSDGYGGEPSSDYARAFARLENHYFFNKCFLSNKQQIMDNLEQIAHIPTAIVHGRYDMICPPKTAWELAKALPNSYLKLVNNAGHAISETGIARELVAATDRIARNML